MTLSLLCLLLACAAAFAAHRHDIEVPWHRRLPLFADLLPTMMGATFYALFLAAFGRPVLSMLLVAGGSLGIWALNKVKLSLYKDPTVFMDLFLVPEILRHPEFYTPYLLPRRAIIWLLASCLVLAGLFTWEPVVDAQARKFSLILLLLCALWQWRLWRLFAGKGRGRALRLLQRHKLSLDPREDWQALGLLPSLFLQGLWHRHVRSRFGAPGIPLSASTPPSNLVWHPSRLRPLHHKPHLLLFQAESFFDLRRLSPEIDPELLRNFDALGRKGMSGELRVPAQGAYTMRTEFSVLTGLPLTSLGTDALDPYFSPARRPAWSLARHLRAAGYRTVCLHPFSLAFFNRYKVMPNLGFDELYGEDSFARSERFGPYVSDAALGWRILELLSRSTRPLFVFAISMEAHGPWAADRFEGMEPPPQPPAMPAWGSRELGMYLTHVANTDAMLGSLCAELEGLHTQTVLGFYGDHVGNIPRMYARAGYDNRNTDYLIWHSGLDLGGANRSLSSTRLAGKCLEAMHLRQGPMPGAQD